MVLWGLINRFLVGQSEWVAQAAGLLIAAALLWDVLFRAQLGVSIVFFEEMYSRNLGNLFVSPLRPHELALSLLTVSFLRTAFGIGIAAGLAILLYQYSLFDMGLPLVAFFANLIAMGWAIGLMVVALVLRYGLGVEGLAWAIIFAFAPLSGVYCLQWGGLKPPPLGGSFSNSLLCLGHERLSSWFPHGVFHPSACGVDHQISS